MIVSDKGRQLGNNVLANTLAIISHFVQTVVIVPIVLTYWGAEKYGSWLAISAFTLILQLFDYGHQTYVGNKFCFLYYLDRPQAQRVLSSGLMFSFVIGFFEFFLAIVIALLGQTGGQFLGLHNNTVNSNVEWSIPLMAFAWFICGSAWSLLNKVLLIKSTTYQNTYLNAGLRIVIIVALVVTALKNWSILDLAILSSVVMITYCLISSYFIYRFEPGLFPWWRGASWKIGWKNFYNSLTLTMNSLVEQSTANGLLLIISSLLGATATSAFATLRTLSNTGLKGNEVIISSFYADLIRFQTQRQADKIRQVFIFNWFASGILTNIGGVTMLLFVETFYHWWTNGQLTLDLSIFSILLFSVMIANYNRTFSTYLQAINSTHGLLGTSLVRFFTVALICLFGVDQSALLAVGWSLVISELSATVFLHYFAQRELAQMKATLATKVFFFAFSPIILAGCLLWLATNIGLSSFYYSWQFFGLMGLLVLAYSMLWGCLSSQAKQHVWNTVRWLRRSW
jgi:O-antigen/teichoic acid export membrane protein